MYYKQALLVIYIYSARAVEYKENPIRVSIVRVA